MKKETCRYCGREYPIEDLIVERDYKHKWYVCHKCRDKAHELLTGGYCDRKVTHQGKRMVQEGKKKE